MNRWARFLAEGYSRVLGLYPAGYRAIFAEEQQVVFNLAVDEAARCGWLSLSRLAVLEFFSLPGAVFRQHLKERTQATMGTDNNLQSWIEKLSWKEILAALAIFLLPAFDKILQIGVLVPLRIVLLPAFLLVCLGLFIYGIIKGFPRWWMPYGGLGLAGLAFLVFAIFGSALNEPVTKLLGSIMPRVTSGDENARLLYSLYSAILLWTLYLIGNALALLILGLLPPFRKPTRRMRADWTLVSFFFYGVAIFMLVLAFEEYRYEGPYLIASALCLVGGAWLYLRGKTPWRRWLALLAGLSLAMGIVAFGKWMIVPLQDWPQWFTWHPQPVERRFETLRTVFDWLGMAGVLLAPALLNLLPKKKMEVAT